MELLCNRKLIIFGILIGIAALASYYVIFQSGPVVVSKGSESEHTVEWILFATAVFGFLAAGMGLAREIMASLK